MGPGGGVCHTPIVVCVCVFQSQLCPTLVLQQTMCTYIPITWSHGSDDGGDDGVGAGARGSVSYTYSSVSIFFACPPMSYCVCVCVCFMLSVSADQITLWNSNYYYYSIEVQNTEERKEKKLNRADQWPSGLYTFTRAPGQWYILCRVQSSIKSVEHLFMYMYLVELFFITVFLR